MRAHCDRLAGTDTQDEVSVRLTVQQWYLSMDCSIVCIIVQ